MTIHGVVRTTKDIDLLVRRADLERVLEAIRPLGYKFVALPMTFEKGTLRERHLQRVTKIEGTDHLIIDLMLDEGALAGFLAESMRVELPSGPLRVVTREALVRMKRLANRSQDRADLEKLDGGS